MSKGSQYYTKDFYDKMQDNNIKTAKEMMPYIINCLNPRSVVDIGCGRGIFLKEIKELRPDIKILGIDGDYVKKEALLINSEDFLAYDLSQRLNLKISFDLAISFEVAEHLNEDRADIFINNICKMSDVIIFSAAIPLQGGTHHINEQWPSYWNRKFQDRGYFVSDCLRRYFWKNTRIAPLRRQNIMLYIKKEKFQCVENCFVRKEESYEDIVHPEFWMQRQKNYRQKLNELESICSIQQTILDNVLNDKIDDLIKMVKKMSIYEMADNLNLLEYLKRKDIYIFENIWKEKIENTRGKEKIIIWGAGEDGKRIKRLLEAMDRRVVKICDSYKNDENIISVEDMIKEYDGELIIIASRKYNHEIVKTINKINEIRNSKKLLFYYE